VRVFGPGANVIALAAAMIERQVMTRTPRSTPSSVALYPEMSDELAAWCRRRLASMQRAHHCKRAVYLHLAVIVMKGRVPELHRGVLPEVSLPIVDW
jgi:hypothetical protein